MELELGLKITRTKDDDQTSTDFRITKDQTGFLFFSRETEAMFILAVHLKGFEREKIKIDINEEGTLIKICAEKLIQEMVMVGWTMRKKGVEICAFKKVFRIPDGVVLDGINAKFNEEQSVLMIQIPKSIKGIKGVGIEEMKEKIDTLIVHEASESTKQAPAQDQETSSEYPSNVIQQAYELAKQAPAQDKDGQNSETEIQMQNHDLGRIKNEAENRPAGQEREKAQPVPIIPVDQETKNDQEKRINEEKVKTDQSAKQAPARDKDGQNPETETQMQNHDSGDNKEIKKETEIRPAGQELEQAQPILPVLPVDQETKNDQEKRLNEEKVQTDESSDAGKQKSVIDQADETNGNDRSELFGPCFYAGSAFFISLIALVVHFIRGKKR